MSRDMGAPSLLGADMRIDGDVVSKGPLRIEGFVQGDVRAPVLAVGSAARVGGRVKAGTASIDGTVDGGIDAGTVELSKSAKVTGDITHEILEIEAGAFVDGTFRRSPTG